MTVMLRANEINWSLADSAQPAARHVAADVGPPSGLTSSRADLVILWRSRYAALEAEQARVGDLLAQALGESQGYRVVLQAALDALREQARQHDRLCEQHHRLRDEYRRHRQRTRRDVPRAGRRTPL